MTAVAVFDGMGGLSHGAEAAQAGAANLGAALADAQTERGILRRLNRCVAATGGGTTAAIAVLREVQKHSTVLTIGDSPIYARAADGKVGPLTGRDRHGRHHLADYLGREGATGHVRHVLAVERLLLCTDGFEDRLGSGDIERIFGAPPETVPSLLRRILSRGSAQDGLDDATAIVVVRRSEAA